MEGLEKENENKCRIFFFQAEDGIRDIGVTGVQTCALPISLLPMPTLLRPPLREPARGQDASSLEKGAEDQGAAGRQHEHDGAFPGEAQRDASKDIHEDVLGASRGRDGTPRWYEGMAEQAGEADELANQGKCTDAYFVPSPLCFLQAKV